MPFEDTATASCSSQPASQTSTDPKNYPLGANWNADGTCSFLVWAPRAKRVELRVVHPENRTFEMQRLESGYFFANAEAGIRPGALYRYCLISDEGEKERPDPASRLQPHGVHGPSEVVDPRFDWTDRDWRSVPLQKYVFYEVHIGTLTREGTFDAAISRLDDLKELGITAIEIMPVAQFSGSRNWGYDGVCPFAVQNSYGGPMGLKRFVDACHARGLAVVLDVVYNHLGPVGNYTADYANYSTDSYKTPWGDGMNFDGRLSDEVRRFFTDNALQWVTEFHIDALRLDAVHEIVDTSADPFLRDLATAVHDRADKLRRQVYLIAESDRNDRKIFDSAQDNGFGFDGVWNDDFHHALHVMLTGETAAYFQDFCGGVEDLAQAWREGFIYTGQYSKYREHHHGSPSRDIPAKRFMVFVQNHDQVGNRTIGERVSHIVPLEKVKLATGTVILSPYLPMIFMGEEYAEDAPFQYFVSYEDPALIEAIHEGRKNDFKKFQWAGEHPNPGSEDAFNRSKLNWDLRREGNHAVLLDFHRELLRLRRDVPALAQLDKDSQAVIPFPEDKVLLVERWHQGSRVCMAFHYGDGEARIRTDLPAGRWQRVIDSAEAAWGGSGAISEAFLRGDARAEIRIGPWAFVLYQRVA